MKIARGAQTRIGAPYALSYVIIPGQALLGWLPLGGGGGWGECDDGGRPLALP